MNTEYKVEAGTIIRLIVLAIAFANQILTMTGHPVLPIDSDETANAVATIITAIVALWGYWKNNSFTKNAIKADEVLKELRESDKAGE